MTTKMKYDETNENEEMDPARRTINFYRRRKVKYEILNKNGWINPACRTIRLAMNERSW